MRVCEMVILAFTWDLIENLLFAPLDLAEYKGIFKINITCIQPSREPRSQIQLS